MFRLQIECSFVCVIEGVADITQIYALNEHLVPKFELRALMD
jgi:hypothetical protein